MNDDKLDFTEKIYEQMLYKSLNQKRFIGYSDEIQGNNDVIWRHDVDMSPQRALALAKIEKKLKIQATYFFMLTSDFYNLIESSNACIVREIHAMGHAIGIHFDPSAHLLSCKGGFDLEEALYNDKICFQKILKINPVAFSFHNPDVGNWLNIEDESLSGLINAYSSRMKTGFRYCSDSNGYWRFDRLIDVMSGASSQPLHVLTHPEWWTPDVLTPRERINRCASGKYDKVMNDYDEFLMKNGRLNIK